MDINDCIVETMEHADNVIKFISIIKSELTHRACTHDKSKMESPEVEIFAEYTPKLKNSTYGSDE